MAMRAAGGDEVYGVARVGGETQTGQKTEAQFSLIVALVTRKAALVLLAAIAGPSARSG